MEKEINLAKRTQSSVLILGPTGSGKTRLAREIHEQSLRAKKPFHVVNLATLHEGTFESELFGHERGAFTGADQKKQGRLELAQGGTLFLDEVGDLPLRLQGRLLDVLQSKVFTPVGGQRMIQLDVRVIAATHRNLKKMVQRGEFREDLYHRLRVLTIELPSLAQTGEKFDSIFHHVLAEVSKEQSREVKRVSEGFAEAMEKYSWPGNIRELRNVLEYAVMCSEGDQLAVTDLPAWFGVDTVSGSSGVSFEVPLGSDFRETLTYFERLYFRQALGRSGGRINRAAEISGVPRSTFKRRIKELQLSLE